MMMMMTDKTAAIITTIIPG